MRKLLLVVSLLTVVLQASAQTVPSPKEHFGFSIGDDYMLANYTQTEAYFRKLAAASDRVRLVDIGQTEEGRHQYMLVVSAPQNLARYDRYRAISRQLARAEDSAGRTLTDGAARALAKEGKAVVWIDGGLHATETVGAHQLIETIWQFVSRNDEETRRILDDAIILFVHANPDGQELVANWYMRNADPKARSYRNLPRPYQKYVGHDNNRDFYMMNMKESQNMSRELYIDWLPQIVYNHHQTGPAGSVLAGPPYRDPFNYVFDPLLVTSLDAVGAAMNNRLNTEGKPGYTQRAGSVFSTWWNGGLRTTPYFHHSIGILTEIIGDPTPMKVPLVPGRLLPNGATPNPVTPQEWHFRQSIDYSVSLNYAVLDYAVRHKDELLYNRYVMAKRSIEAGSSDHWTLSPRLIDSVSGAYRKDKGLARNAPLQADTLPAAYFDKVFRDPSLRDARVYILPSDQPDISSVYRLINALQWSGVQVLRAAEPFTAGGKSYPAGSFVLRTAQAFRPHLMDLFEPQDHPNDFQYPGGPPVPPYDAAGWTPAYTMGIRFDKLQEDVTGNFLRLPYESIEGPSFHVATGGAAGFLLSPQNNAHYRVVNDLLAAGAEVYRINTDGSFFLPKKDYARLQTVDRAGLRATAVARRPAGLQRLQRLRIGLFEPYGGTETSGWARWILEEFHYPAESVYVGDLDKGELRDRFDVLVFASGTVPAPGARRTQGPKPETIPEEFRGRLGSISTDTTLPALRRFLEGGGRIVAIGSATSLAYQLRLPVRNALTEILNGEERPLPNEKFYIPGSVLRMQTAAGDPATWGLPDTVDVVFARSPAFSADPGALASGRLKVLAWYPAGNLLRSGWAWGPRYLENTLAAFAVPVGSGTFYGFGPEILFRGQAEGSFRLLFNQLYGLHR
ncbi:M14 family metallopeptidase [Flaviaesturariibacter terrae]